MIKFFKCTAEQYALLSKNDDDFYYVTDTDKFYLGEIELSNPDVSNFLTSVIAADNSITVTNNNEINVKISAKTGNNLSLETGTGEEGLYVTVPTTTDYTVTVTETAGSGSDPYSKRYNIVQTASSLNANIDIPKDMVVSSGSVVDITYDSTTGKLYDNGIDVTSLIKGSGTASAADAGKYIKLIIANSTSSVLYISVKDLVDIYTVQPNATQVQLAIDSNNVISAAIVAGSVGTTELANGAVTTDKIASGAVTTAKLGSDVTAELAKAGTAVQSIAQGANNGEIKYTVDGTNYTAVSVKGLGSAAYTNTDAYATAAQGTKADSAIQSVTTGDSTSGNGTIKVDGTAVSVYGLGSAAYTESSAYATAAQGTAADSALQKADITTGTTNGTIKVKGDAVSVYGLDTAAYAKTTDFDAAGSAATVQSTLIGSSSDTASANTIYGAKAYADSILEWRVVSSGNTSI